MTTLHDRLADLADDARPAAPAVPSDELWRRGRSYGRRRRTAVVTLVLAGLVALATGVLSLGPVRPGTVQPAENGAGLRLPDRLHQPSAWTPGTDETGPFGPLVAVVGAERASWTGSRNGIAGVNADGDYAFLDLEGQVGDRLALSPDGRHLAYWFAEGAEDGGDYVAADGIAVLDTVTGETSKQEYDDAPLGLDPQPLVWAGDVLWASFWPFDSIEEYDGASSAGSTLRQVLTWDQSTDEQTRHDPAGVFLRVLDAPAWGDRLLLLRRQAVTAVAPSGATEVLARITQRVDGAPQVDPTGTRLAFLGETDPAGEASDRAEPVLVGRLSGEPGGAVELTTLSGPRVDRVVGWRSDHEVVTYRYRPGAGGPVYESVDVDTGERTTLVTSVAESWEPGELVAAEALAAPSFAAPEPPSHRDPRLVLAAGTGLSVVTALGALFLWRRRVRA